MNRRVAEKQRKNILTEKLLVLILNFNFYVIKDIMKSIVNNLLNSPRLCGEKN